MQLTHTILLSEIQHLPPIGPDKKPPPKKTKARFYKYKIGDLTAAYSGTTLVAT